MPQDTLKKRARIFVDGQNLYHQARESFDYGYPNYNVMALSQLVCTRLGYVLCGVNFYTGIPREKNDKLWADFWNKKRSRMARTGVVSYFTYLKYSEQSVWEKGESGKAVNRKVLVAREKGIDIRIAIDVLKVCRNNSCDVAVIFSQDQDLWEAVKETKAIAKSGGRNFEVVSAFPVSDTSNNIRGINDTKIFRINKEDYDKCLDNTKYFDFQN